MQVFEFFPAKLVDNLPAEKMSILNKYFSNETEEQRCLIRQKGFYPYSYMTKREKFAEKELPPLLNWPDVLNGGKVAVSQADLEHARKVFKCQNLRRIITTCISSVIHSFLLASLKNFDKLVTKLMVWTARTILVLQT